ncbi:14.7 kDa ribonuclease H-like protein [Juglans microcarpa x Juglans regia]|uniref:14.7 kDa ribonuclease H-like protein n=1 Tax=Juglans microcarpa x Juglans regia TaxID=2249226 RepID=UPI001B7F5013|nr:14.7 kDa ribonuclease H-like protein [Juglans microcarpa x Juglans regia]
MDEHILRRLNVLIVEKSKVQVKVVQWVKPRMGRLKLNLDGSYFGNPSPASRGGLLRDYGGNLVFGFSKFFYSCSNNEAELQAVIEGIKICRQRGLMCIDIECDSLLVVLWIRSRICTVWYLWDYWDELLMLLANFDFSISHVFREGNQVADALAKCGALGENNIFIDCLHLPWVIRGLYRLDKMGTAYVSCRR